MATPTQSKGTNGCGRHASTTTMERKASAAPSPTSPTTPRLRYRQQRGSSWMAAVTATTTATATPCHIRQVELDDGLHTMCNVHLGVGVWGCRWWLGRLRI